MFKTKMCKKCDKRKDIDDFYNSTVYKTGKAYICKVCQNFMRKRWIKDDAERYKESNRRAGLKHKFGMSVETYDEMMHNQKNCCAVCKTTNPNGEGVENGKNRYFSVDHDHTTGAVRGLLCNKCNRCLSFMQDNVKVLAEAIKYLNRANNT